jgi:hypothetical protein
MNRPDTTAKLREFRAAAERIGATLVDLELDPGRQTLDASSLTGESAKRWRAGREALTELWRCQGLFETMIERADRARGGELRELLLGRSIELRGPDVPITQRALLPGDTRDERSTPDELLQLMSALFDTVTDALAAVTHPWETLLPRLEEARRRLALARDLAHDIGLVEHGELDRAADAVRVLGERISSDPLSVPERDVENELTSLAELVADLERDAELKRGIELRIRAARAQLERIGEAVGEAGRAVEILELKIASPSATEIPPAPDDLADELDRIAATVDAADWRATRLALERWSVDADARLHNAQGVCAASRAPIATRNEFRALLDAYAVKAKRLGLIEEPDVAEIFEQAHAELYTAPTDVVRAGELIRRYQQALTGVTTRPEVRG